jgi:hypothetical protein
MMMDHFLRSGCILFIVGGINLGMGIAGWLPTAKVHKMRELQLMLAAGSFFIAVSQFLGYVGPWWRRNMMIDLDEIEQLARDTRHLALVPLPVYPPTMTPEPWNGISTETQLGLASVNSAGISTEIVHLQHIIITTNHTKKEKDLLNGEE